MIKAWIVAIVLLCGPLYYAADAAIEHKNRMALDNCHSDLECIEACMEVEDEEDCE